MSSLHFSHSIAVTLSRLLGQQKSKVSTIHTDDLTERHVVVAFLNEPVQNELAQ